MSDKVTSADNQQGSLTNKYISYNPSETTRRAPFSQKGIKAYLLGALHDATFSSNKRYRFSQKGEEWLNYLQKLFKRIDYNSWIYKEGRNRDIYVLETLASFLDFSFNPLNFKSKIEKINYVKGFFDAEGGIPHNAKARFYIQLVQKDKDKLEKIKLILSELNIVIGKVHNPSVNVDPDYWRMYVLSNSWNKFVKVIGSWHPYKISILSKRMMI